MNPWIMESQPTQQRRTFNRELDLESGMWEAAIRSEERAKVLEEAKTVILDIIYNENLEDPKLQTIIVTRLNQLKGNHE